jgi:hypothetical protein
MSLPFLKMGFGYLNKDFGVVGNNANNGLNGFLCLFTPQVKTCG